MNKHTPGPWSYSMYEGSNHAKIYLHGLGRQDAVKGGDSMQGYCGEANAKLIAAAPVLLEALGLMVATFCDTEGSHGASEAEAIDKARAAIRKATGE
jgi:hypothetical protein